MIEYQEINQKNKALNKWIRVVFLILFLVMPDDFFKATSIYHSETLRSIAYKWLDYDFSGLFVIIFILALTSITRRENGFFLFSLFLFIRSVIYYLAGIDNIFSYSSYELQLSFLCGWTLYVVAKRWKDTYFESDNFTIFEIFCWIHLASQIWGMIFSISGVDNRYNAINLDVENTGFLYALYILLKQERDGTTGIKSYIFLIGILFTGARIPLILLLLVLSIQKLKIYINDIKKKETTVGTLVELIAIVVVFGIIASGGLANMNGKLSGISRISEILTNPQDKSVIGRIQSLQAGLNILKENYWGTDCSYVILQKYTVAQGYPTFPHSQVLLCRIILGPILFWTGVFLIYTKLRNCFRSGYGCVFPLMFILLFFIVTGNPCSNFKVVFIYIWALHMCMTMEQYDRRKSIEVDG